MNRFLKKEWDDTEIPQDVLWRTRNRAWQQLRQRQRGRRLLIPLAAAVSLAGPAVFLWWGSPGALQPRPTEEAARLPAASGPLPSPAVPKQPGAAEEDSAAVQPVRTPPVRRVQTAAPAVQPRHPAVAATAPTAAQRPELERLVINFRLPRSGVRMIWIKQNTPASPNGGTG